MMSIARSEAAPRRRIAPPSSWQSAIDRAPAARLRLYLGMTALMALAAVAALGFDTAGIQGETGVSLASPEAEPPRFDGRGKWGGYAH